MTSNAAAASTLVDLFQLVSGAQPGGMGEGAAASTLVDLFQLVSGAQPGMGEGLAVLRQKGGLAGTLERCPADLPPMPFT